MSKGWKNNIGRMVKKKNGKGYFLIFGRRKDKDGKPLGENHFPLTINEGDIVQMKTKSDDLANLVREGKMSQETADKICESVKFELAIAPPKEDGDAKTEAADTSDDNSGVDF
jgi:hypothetical protein